MKDEPTSGPAHTSHVPLLCPLTRSPVQPDAVAPVSAGRAPRESVEYPEIGGVRVIVPAASAVLAATLLELNEERERFDQQSSEPPRLDGALPERTRERYEAYLAAERCNIELFEKHCASIGDYLGRERELARGLTSALAIQLGGWKAPTLLPYFYQDWGNTPSFEEARTRLDAVLERHVEQRGALAILGCGAGGLVGAFADRFEGVAGVDLSISGLLMVRHLLDGGSLRMALHAENPDLPEFPITTVHGAAPARRNAMLVAANAADLPFPDASLSCVITQYLLDIVADAGAVAAEVNRVLADGGVWVNYGCPFRLPSDPPVLRARVAADMPAWLQALGFETLEASSHRHDHLNLSTLTPEAVTRQHRVVLFAARKHSAMPPRPDVSAFEAYFRGDERALFEARPRLTPAASLTYLIGSEHRGEGTRPTALFGVGRHRFATFGASAACPGVLTTLVHRCLQRFDGKSSVAEVFDDLHHESAGLLSESDFAVALKLLRNLAWIELF